MFANAPFIVQANRYREPVRAWSHHRSPAAACRVLARIIRRTRGLETARLYSAREGRSYSLDTARALLASGHFEGMR